MAEHPIIFSAPMIRALIEGRKTMTRRLLNPHRATIATSVAPGSRLWVRETWSHDGPDIATVRAAHEDLLAGGIGYGPYYRATEVAPETLNWRSPIHMPRWASRIILTVTAVRIEQLHDITEGDAKAEGLISQVGDGGAPGSGYKWKGIGYHGGSMGEFGMSFHIPHWNGKPGCACNIGGPSPAQCAFRELWERLHGAGSWLANPEVSVISFERLTP